MVLFLQAVRGLCGARVHRGRGRGGASRAGSPTAFPTAGQQGAVLQKQHYASGVRTCGQGARVLTRSRQHPRGFKVELSDGTIGRVVEILEAPCDYIAFFNFITHNNIIELYFFRCFIKMIMNILKLN